MPDIDVNNTTTQLKNEFVVVSVTANIYQLTHDLLRSVIRKSIHPSEFAKNLKGIGLSSDHQYSDDEISKIVSTYKDNLRGHFRYAAKMSITDARVEVETHGDLILSTIEQVRGDDLMPILNHFAQRTSNPHFSTAASIGSAQLFGDRAIAKLQRLQASQRELGMRLATDLAPAPTLNRKASEIEF